MQQQAHVVPNGFVSVSKPTTMVLRIDLLRDVIKKNTCDASKFPEIARFRAIAASFCDRHKGRSTCEVSVISYLKGQRHKVDVYQVRVPGSDEPLILAEKFLYEAATASAQ